MYNSGIPPTVSVRYTIAGSSESSGRYVAENILVDNPTDQSSRWSGAHQSPYVEQWLLLRLEKLSVLKSITFGKFHKQHPCNMKEFKVYVGLTEDNMIEVLHHAGLRNDDKSETFAIRTTNIDSIYFPTRYVKIVPLSAHGHSFHISIWHIAMTGITDEAYVEQINAKYHEYREVLTMRHLLKHLRQRRFLTPFHEIVTRSGLQLEHPLVGELYDTLVMKSDWSRSEQIIHMLSSAGLFNSYRNSCQPRAQWARLRGLDPDGDVPGRRGGHAMCMDEESGLIYLFGGWDGQKNLDDFWRYDVHTDTWRMLSMAASRDHGPTPRACHKMVFDNKTGCIYLLGRLGDESSAETTSRSEGRERPTTANVLLPTDLRHEPGGSRSAARDEAASWTSYRSDFYRYHTRGLDVGKWDLLTIDTASAGGPPLIFDHQMEIDSESQIIYVSGGCVVDNSRDVLKYSGLYAYNIRAGTWEILQMPDDSSIHPSITSRFGHSMVLDPKSQTLFIFAGQRSEKYLPDMYTYHIPSGTVTELFPNFTMCGGPEACFTQRAVIDPELQEIYVFCGLTRSRNSSVIILESESPNWMYRYDHPDQPGKWAKIPPAIVSGELSNLATYLTDTLPELPSPRYAHQVVYDITTKAVYMHGGNSGCPENSQRIARSSGSASRFPLEGSESMKEIRLDDLWKMQLQRPTFDEIVRKSKYRLRQQQFREMCEDSPPDQALAFLQTEVSSVVNHHDSEEALVFRSLLTHLLTGPPDPGATINPSAEKDEDTDMEESSPEQIAPTSVFSLELFTEDQVEKSTGSGTSLSAARFRQRTEVFEKLLLFVNRDAKQPDNDLLDMMHR